MAEDTRKEPESSRTMESMPAATGPDNRPTAKVDKDEVTRQLMDRVLVKLTEIGASQTETTRGVAELGGKVDVMGGKLDTVTIDVHAIKSEQVEFREWKGAVEERFKSHSLGATALVSKTQTLSVHDDHQDVKLQELENRLAVAAESSMRAILAEAAVAAKTPLGRKVVTAGGYMMLAAFGLGTLYMGVVSARLQGQQPVQIIQVAPVVTADAGAPQ